MANGKMAQRMTTWRQSQTPCVDKIKIRMHNMGRELGEEEETRCILDYLTEYEELARAPKATDKQLDGLLEKTRRALDNVMGFEWGITEDSTLAEFPDVREVLKRLSEEGRKLALLEELSSSCAEVSVRMELLQAAQGVVDKVNSAKTRLEKLLAIESFVALTHAGGGPQLARGCMTADPGYDPLILEVLDCLAGREKKTGELPSPGLSAHRKAPHRPFGQHGASFLYSIPGEASSSHPLPHISPDGILGRYPPLP